MWEAGKGADFKVKVVDVDTTGFNYKVTAGFDRPFN
jgi:hypothetical protein